MPSSKTWFVIVNPTSGNGSCKKKWPDILELLKMYEFHFEHVFTEYPNHGIELTQNAIYQGFRRFICVGGDGTLHHIVNGIMSQKHVVPNQIHVGVVPIGTGNDWVKTHNIPKNLERAILLIKNGHPKQQDVGKIEFLNSSKKPIYFINLAGIGFDGLVVSKVHKYKHFGALAYVAGALLGLFLFKNFQSRIMVNSKVIETKTFMVLVGLCKYSGGGMQLTKSPNPFDGLFDISLVKNIGKWDILKNMSKLFNGNITKHNKVETSKSNSVAITVLDNSNPYIEADGELIDGDNVHLSLIPNSFSFYGGTKNAKQTFGANQSG
ncbi:diacylglycerol/lipid kinase family protein [Xanthomarina gelatinilytica]|uniref:diacylglycerol/lipid kinase family protein n=1 Tax=Xanthomarina gelatinilytica TaxID=1137281 RepID=UPI003AA8DF30